MGRKWCRTGNYSSFCFRVLHKVDGIKACIMHFSNQTPCLIVMADTGQLTVLIVVFGFREEINSPNQLWQNQLIGRVLISQLSHFSTTGDDRIMRVHGPGGFFLQFPDSLRNPVNLGIVHVIGGFRDIVIISFPCARSQNQREQQACQPLFPPPPEIVALQLFALDAQHGGDNT